MNNLLDQPLSQIVLANYQTADILENNGLDFCCGGKQTLRAACKEKAIGVETILDQLNDVLGKPDGSVDFQRLSLSTLADYIVDIHHTYVQRNLPVIASYLLKISTKHGERFPHIKQAFELFSQVKDELESHLVKEEQVVFPAIKELDKKRQSGDAGFLTAPIDVLEEEHELAGTLMREIRELTNNYKSPQGACTTFQLTMNALAAFESDLHKHVHLENNILFPKAIALFEQIKHAS